jgi:DNA processing protein
MDLHTAVSLSMLPLNRSRVAAVFKELRQQEPGASLELVLDALCVDSGARIAFASAARAAADEALEAASGLMDPVAWFDPRYPSLLAGIVDPPPVVWVQGNAAFLSRAAVAVIGSRAATPYASAVGHRLAGELAERGVVVASGLARGVDSAAHRGCLQAGGCTVAVLGSGLDNVYPPEHEDLAAEIARKGAVVSELGPGAAPLPEHFPLRNRIISGISLAVVVVEASEQSGSLITARCALEQGRDVMAVPGSVLSGRNRGSQSLRKDGAKVVETAEDILQELGLALIQAGPSSPPAVSREPTGDRILDRMEAGEGYQVDELMTLTGMTAAQLLPRMTDLELAGRVSVSGGRYTRVVGS